jgi:hypothetical protein
MMPRYRPGVLAELLRHGVSPGADTPQPRVRRYLNDVYRYRLRRLRDRLYEGDIPKREYASHVVALRVQYPLLSLPDRFWTE